jgi:hypothetical protein
MALPIPTILFLALLYLALIVPSQSWTLITPFMPRSALLSMTELDAEAPRKPRRMLPKRKRKGRGSDQDSTGINADDTNASFWQTGDVRSIVKGRSKELGEDYWIDEKALLKEQERQELPRKRKPEPGQISNEKLWSEVLSPYKNNCEYNTAVPSQCRSTALELTLFVFSSQGSGSYPWLL